MKLQQDRVMVVETNVDDVTGEVLSRTIERLIAEGAEDAYALSYIGKKDRLGYNLKVVCKKKFSRKLAEVIIEETGTLGVKLIEHTRLAVPREVVSVPFKIKGFNGRVPVKVSTVDGRIHRVKPEFEIARKIAEKEKVPLRVVIEGISNAARDFQNKRRQKESAGGAKGI